MSGQLPCQPVTVAIRAKHAFAGPSDCLSMDSLMEVWRKMSMADFFSRYHQSIMARGCILNRRCTPGKGNTASDRKVSITSELHNIQKNWVIKKTQD